MTINLNRQDYFICCSLILLAVIIGLMAIYILPRFPVISDSLDYDQIAEALVENFDYITISAQAVIYPPLYPVFLALIYFLVGHSYVAVYLTQFLLLGGISATTYLIARQLNLSKPISIITGVTTIIWPYFILYSLLVSSEILFIFFLILYLYTIILFLSNPTLKTSIGSGLLIGLAVLTRPVALLLPIWISLFILAISYLKSSPFTLTKNHYKNWIISLVIFLITLLPWVTYVYLKYDRLIPVASNLSYVFDKANKSLAYLETENTSLTTANNLTILIKAKLLNIYLFWDPGASGYNVDTLLNNHPNLRPLLLFYKLAFYIVIISGLLAIKKFFQSKEIALGFIILIYFWSLHTVLFPFPRYTLPVIPIIIILAFYSWQIMIKTYRP